MSARTHLLLIRACGPAADSANAQAKIAYCKVPTDGTVAEMERQLSRTFEDAFGTPPARVASAVLPYVSELDD